MFDRKAVIGVTLTAEEMAALPYADLEELAIDLGFDDVTFSDDNPLDAVVGVLLTPTPTHIISSFTLT